MAGERPGQHLKTSILQQPDVVSRLLAEDQPATTAAERLSECSRIFLVGTGTSFHGCLIGQFLLRSIGLDAFAVPAFEFTHYPPRLKATDGLILLSHRGNKRFSRASLDAMRDNQRWIAITGDGAPLEGEGVVRTVPQEISPVHTVSHLAAMVRLVQIARHLGGPQTQWAQGVMELAAAIGKAVALGAQSAHAAERISGRRLICLVGGGPGWATALEGALKIREAAYVPTIAYEVEEVLHGPMTSMQERDAAVLIVEAGPSLERMVEVAAGLKEIGVSVVAVGSAANQAAADLRMVAPLLPEVIAPLVNVVPLQWLAYYVADSLGVNADSFRRDEPRYAAAYERYEL
ncbi:MAG TPA: SIS domain-containing protein [Candidatus Dormibacteraeota bacterium]|nr:SIS domain-containing protein [Candidatus Dormibacteraeota bacterium]